MASTPIPATFPTADEDALQALQGAVSVLAAKWSVIVLARLASGTHRFNELLRQIDGVSRRMLSATLRQLERDGLVKRHVYARVPARVEYELSPLGENLLVALAPLAGWSVANRTRVTDARERFDRLQQWRAESEQIQARSGPRIV
ncbi:MAG: winged helix-turn-helix transcriptional regulator [Solirubrobacteraceae bacterium]